MRTEHGQIDTNHQQSNHFHELLAGVLAVSRNGLTEGDLTRMLGGTQHEYVAGVAVTLHTGPLTPPLHHVQPVPVPHSQVSFHLYRLGKIDGPVPSADLGYVTSRGRVVGAAEAMTIAKAALQLMPGCAGVNNLMPYHLNAEWRP